MYVVEASRIDLGILSYGFFLCVKLGKPTVYGTLVLDLSKSVQ